MTTTTDTPEIMTRSEMLETLRQMLYFKLMELHLRLAAQNFSESDSTDLSTFTAVREALQSLDLMGMGDLTKKLYEEDENEDDTPTIDDDEE